MPPAKLVLKCGNFAVLVDLHVLPPGSGEEASWFAEEHQEEVCEMIRDLVDQRVCHFLETRHQRGQPKPKKGLTPASPVCLKGERFRLAAYFMKRHANLRCVGGRHHGELRVFPERLVVCASVAEATVERGGERDLTAVRPAHIPSLLCSVCAEPAAACPPLHNARMEHGGQSKSEYFSGHHETEDPLNSSAITKRNTLHKIAKKAGAKAHPSQRGALPLSAAMETEGGRGATSEEREGNRDQTSTAAPAAEGTPVRDRPQREEPRPGRRGAAGPLEGAGRAKRVCFGQAPASPSEATAEKRSTESLSQTDRASLLVLRSKPSPPALGSSPPVLGPSPPALGPSPPALGPSPPALGPSPPALGPSPPALGPSPPALGPSPPALGPSPPALGSSPPALGPSPPVLGPSPPALGPSPPALGPSPPALGPSPPALGSSPPALGPSPPALGPSPPALGPSPLLGKGPTGQKSGPRPMVPPNDARLSRGGRAGRSAGDGNTSSHSGTNPSDAQPGGETLPRRSRLKRIKKA